MVTICSFQIRGNRGIAGLQSDRWFIEDQVGNILQPIQTVERGQSAIGMRQDDYLTADCTNHSEDVVSFL